MLKDSEYSDNYASGYESWREDILRSYAHIAQSLDGLIGVPIVDHAKMAEQVYATTYETGDVIYVNYSKNDVTLDGITVPARGSYREGGNSK